MMSRFRVLPLAVVTAAVVACAVRPAIAQLIVPVGASAYSEFNGRAAVNTVNGNGVIDLGGGNLGHSVAPSPNMWLTNQNQTSGPVYFDLGARYAVDTIRVWNYNEYLEGRNDLLARGVASADVSLGNSLDSFTPALTGQALAIAPGTEDVDFSESFPLGGGTARFVRLDVLGNHGSDFTGLSEVRFTGSFVGPVSGPPKLSVASVVASSEIAAPFSRPAVHTIDGSGLFGDAWHNTGADGFAWLSGQNDIAPDITWDLGSVVPITSVKVWNYNENANPTCCLGRGINDTDIYLSDDGENFTLWGNHDFAIAPGLGTVDFSEDVAIGASARFVRFDVLSNHGDGGFTGISEVQFYGIPEPSPIVWLAFAGPLMLLVRRRRR